MIGKAQQATHWHTVGTNSIQQELQSFENGLTRKEAKNRLAEFGPNALPHAPPVQWWQVVLRQFQSPLIYILGVAAVVSVVIGESKDAAFIAVVLSLNAAVGAYQEWRAEKSALALQKLLKTRAIVERNGEVYEVDAEEIVPGDVVWLESGNRVPADARLLMSHGFEVDESLLTGESLPVSKQPDWIGTEETPVADRLNMVYAGAIVTRGRAKAMTVATGSSTSVGQLALDVLSSRGGRPPLLARMERFSRTIAIAVLLASVLLVGLGLIFGKYGISELFFFSVALVVAVIPEGLPVAMTIALAIATTRMAKRNVIVRRMAAVEGLGSCTLIATDKTGTLTCNELTVQEIYLANGERFEVTGEGFAPVGEVLQDGKAIRLKEQPALEPFTRVAVLCNEADLHRKDGSWSWRGDAVDLALLSLGQKLGRSQESLIETHPPINQIPFEPEYQFAASFHSIGEKTIALVKGAPERVLEMCQQDQGTLEHELNIAEEMAGRGYRVLALAEGEVTEPVSAKAAPPMPKKLTFLGLVGMIDPLRPNAKEAIQACHDAGISVTMVTGDHRITAFAIAKELGLATSEDQVLTGVDLVGKSASELANYIDQVRVFARVEPRQKLELVQAARLAGHFVAVTGDGANDAPALREANIGVAMGKAGTDVARESAELVLSDDNFSSIVAGVEEGRIAYDNIRKVIYLLISTGAAELVLMTLAVITGSPLPLIPVQLLWLNLVTQGIQDVALAFEPGEGDTLHRNPRPPRERIFDRLMIERTIVAAIVVGGVGFATFYWMINHGWPLGEARNALLLLIVLFENVHIGNCRSETKSAFSLSPLRSPILLAGAVGALLIHVAAIYTPFGQHILETHSVSIKEWAVYLALALTIMPAMELHKWTWAIRHRKIKAGTHIGSSQLST